MFNWFKRIKHNVQPVQPLTTVKETMPLPDPEKPIVKSVMPKIFACPEKAYSAIIVHGFCEDCTYPKKLLCINGLAMLYGCEKNRCSNKIVKVLVND